MSLRVHSLASVAEPYICRVGNLFNKFMGLPVHPLVDHFAVVLFPVALLGLLAIIVVRPWRARYGWLTMLTLTAGTGFVLVAKESGEQLAKTVGEPHDHAQYADILAYVAIATLVVALVWFVVDRGAHLQARRRHVREGSVDAVAKPAPSAVRGILAGLAVIGSIASLVLVALVGHTGAKATWGGTYAASDATSSPSPSASQTPSETPTPSTSGTPTSSPTPSATSASPTAGSYTLAQVAQHNSQSSCWAAINGNVYDLTKWINQHPGGPDKILQICGKDGSAAFNAQHSQDQGPQADLAQFKIGKLA